MLVFGIFLAFLLNFFAMGRWKLVYLVYFATYFCIFLLQKNFFFRMLVHRLNLGTIRNN